MTGICTECERTGTLARRDLCSACYQRHWKAGTLPKLPLDAYPEQAPGKTATGYLAWLAGLDWPSGWHFWALAGSVGRASASTEWVYLIRQGEIREALVDLTTGSIRQWGAR